MKTITIDGKEYKLVPIEEEVESKYPEVGTKFWYVGEYGQIDWSTWASGTDKNIFDSGNIYTSEHQTKIGALRDEAVRVKNTAKKGEEFWIWAFDMNKAFYIEERDNDMWDTWATQPKFATEQEAQVWGERYGEAILHFNK